MEIIGKFIKALPEQKGESQRGPWVRGGLVIETEEQFPKQVAFSLWGEDKVAIARTMPVGTQLKVFFSPESREFNERWFTDLRCFRIDTFNPITAGATNSQAENVASKPQPKVISPSTPQNSSTPQPEEYGSFNNTQPQEDDDLPF